MQLLIRVAILCLPALAPGSVAAHEDWCGPHDLRDPVVYVTVAAGRPGAVEVRTQAGERVPFEVESLAGPDGKRVLKLTVDRVDGRFDVSVDGRVDSRLQVCRYADVDMELEDPVIRWFGVDARLIFYGETGDFRITWTPDGGGAPVSWTQVDEYYGDLKGYSGRSLLVCLGCAHSGDDSHAAPGLLEIDRLLPDGPVRVFAMRTPVHESTPITRVAVSSLERRDDVPTRTHVVPPVADNWRRTSEGVVLVLVVTGMALVTRRFARRRWTFTPRP